MRLSNLNFVPEADISAETEDLYFPAVNLKHPFRSRRYRSTTTEAKVVFDLKTAFNAVDSVVLLWPKEDGIRLSQNAEIRVQASATANFDSPAFDIELTVNNRYMIASHYFAAPQAFRYWRVTVSDPANPFGYIELGVVWLGASIDAGDCQNGFEVQTEDRTNQTETDFGHVYSDEYPKRRTISIKYEALEYEQAQVVDDAYQANGSSKPVLLVLDEDGLTFDKDHLTVYGLFRSTLGFKHRVLNLFDNDTVAVRELS